MADLGTFLPFQRKMSNGKSRQYLMFGATDKKEHGVFRQQPTLPDLGC
jgi:hypothetical protein